MEPFAPFIKSLALVPLTLLPIINPLSGAPVFIRTAGSNPVVVRRMARQVAINSWCILVASMLVGIYVLDFFGISLPIVRLGGGLLVASSGWRMLNSSAANEVQEAVAHRPERMTRTEIVRRSFVHQHHPALGHAQTIKIGIVRRRHHVDDGIADGHDIKPRGRRGSGGLGHGIGLLSCFAQRLSGLTREGKGRG